MRNDESLKQPFNQMESTRLPGYNSIRNLDHPNEMRVSGRYGETSIPVSAFLRQGANQQAQNLTYDLARNASLPQQIHSTQGAVEGQQQAHYPLPLYTYGIQQQYTPSYRLPVYYEEPMQVREQWERPLDANVKQQQWRFVKTEDKGGVVKYVTRDQQLVQTQPGQWEQYYAPKTVPPPIIPPTREKKTCCTPLLFAFLGLLALIGLILGLVLLLNAHRQAATPDLSSKVTSSYVEPTPGKVIEELPAIPILPVPNITVKPNPVTRPTFTEPITAPPSEKVTTSTATLSSSQQKVINTPAVTMSYGYQQVSPSYSGVNYNNDYQIRDSTISSLPVTTVTSLASEPVTNYETVPTSVTSPTTFTTTTASNSGYDFRVPEGYKIDEFGLLVPV